MGGYVSVNDILITAEFQIFPIKNVVSILPFLSM